MSELTAAQGDAAKPVEAEPRLSGSLLVVMAVACGAIVANLYYLQPLLAEITSHFGVGTLEGSSLNTLIQISYALGLAFLVPLGDRLPRNRFATGVFALSAVSLVVAALVPSFGLLALITCFIGLLSVGGQILIPFAADLAEPAHRGRVVGHMMTGLLGGILLSRTVSGFISELGGWQAVCYFAAAMMAVLAVILHFMLPVERERAFIPYRTLVSGPLQLLKTLPELRRRAWLGAMAFGAFSVLWSTLAFYLSAPPFNYSPGLIGAFGLLGFGGLLAANAAGRLADDKRTGLTTMVSAVLLIVAFALSIMGSTSILFIVVAVIVLDMGVQGVHITNQTIIYALAPEARSRINSAYTGCYFAGGALGSLLGGIVYTSSGWTGSCILGICVGLAVLIPAYFWRRPLAS
ncbi:MAG: MFS transporter [Actinobacteria bacterium]|uniref:Unannotated protein n=1 Tax=freshwater metagenome TaxID=449393 RepID=A0A6J7PF10_9ZZZZ|nr:MFS transporter [Actinomycetota bacterium]